MSLNCGTTKSLAMRYGALDLMRCTEQTAVLMAGAEGRGISKETIAEIGTLSMAGWIAGSPYKPIINVFDELYESGREGVALKGPRQLWEMIAEQNKEASGYYGGVLSDPMEFCFTPVDGKLALSHGETGGTVSCICFAASEDAANPVFLSTPTYEDEETHTGKKAAAVVCPFYLVLAVADILIPDCGGIERLHELVQTAAESCVNRDVEDLVSTLFNGHGSLKCLPKTRGLAVLDEPYWARNYWARHKVPDRKKRIFRGSSIGLNLATFYRNGYDCSVAITRHQHLIASSIAARVLGGALFAIPIGKRPKGGGIYVRTGDVLTEQDFVRTDDAAVVVSGISEHIPLGAVSLREDHAVVHSIYLSAMTGSVRRLKHRIRFQHQRSSMFTSFDSSVYSDIAAGQELPKPEPLSAERWIRRYQAMFESAKRGDKEFSG